ncbi:MAG TPA: hypothetical protein DCM28_18180 [Phycisphaerales bacterium]|nr:hypothetical protein [Phycisphaerales bacterium]
MAIAGAKSGCPSPVEVVGRAPSIRCHIAIRRAYDAYHDLTRFKCVYLVGGKDHLTITTQPHLIHTDKPGVTIP